MKNYISPLILALIFLTCLSFTSALIVKTPYVKIYPGQQGAIKINVKNDLNYDIRDVSVALILKKIPFVSIGSSEKELDDLLEDDDDSATFIIKASTDITPGDYEIPYVITYFDEDNPSLGMMGKEGSFGIRVGAKTNLDFSIDTTNAIIGEKGKVSLKIINKGFGKIKFISIQITPHGFELFSPKKIYIGDIDSNDFDSANFDVLFSSQYPTLSATVEYTDFDNNQKTKILNLPIKVYTKEKALELGLIKKPNYIPYIIIGGLIIIWIIWRKIKKKKRRALK